MLKKILSNNYSEPEIVKPDIDTKGFAMGALFVGAVAVLLVLAGLVVNIIAENKAHRDKWKDYDDYGWS